MATKTAYCAFFFQREGFWYMVPGVLIQTLEGIMKGIQKFMASAVLSAGFLMASSAQAMPIPQFDKMAKGERGDYTVFLIEGAANILASQGDTAGATKIRDLLENDPGQPAKPALRQFVENLNGVRQVNQQHAADPAFKPFEVEHALALTLKQHGIIVPVSKLLLASQSYHPAKSPGSLSASVAQSLRP
jgi:hypothetical protein